MTSKSLVKSDDEPVNANDLLNVMFETIQRVREGEISPSVANAIVNTHSAALRVVKMQMDYAKLTNTTPDIPLLRAVNQNGTEKA